MKKLLILTAAMMVVGVSIAAADGVNLSWNRCTTGGAANGLNYNDPNDGAQGLKLFQSSARLGVAIPDFNAQTSVFDLGFDVPVPTFWGTVSGGCNNNALLAANPSTSNVASPNTTVCPTNLFTAAVSAGGFGVGFPSPNRMRLTVDWATGTAGATVANQLYGMVAMSMDMDSEFNNGCAGSTVPACIVLNSVEMNGIVQPAEKYLIQTQDVRNYITFNGGSSNCPGATPSHNSTWGQVKSLYR